MRFEFLCSELPMSMRRLLAETHLRRGSWQQAACNLFFNMFAASQIPFAYAQMGWHAGSAFFALIILTSWVSGYLLTASCVQCGAYTWPDLGRAAFGDAGAIGIEALQIVGIVSSLLALLLLALVQSRQKASSSSCILKDACLPRYSLLFV